MKTVVIENPVINSPFEDPKRHFRFADEGITNEIVAARRVGSYFIPLPGDETFAAPGNLSLFNNEASGTWIN